MRFSLSSRVILFVILIMFPIIALGQEMIRGKAVSAEDGSPLFNARVTLRDSQSGRILAYTFSDASGFFVIRNGLGTLPLNLEISLMGYAKWSTLLEAYPKESIEVKLALERIELNEVRVVAPRVAIKGDTLSYHTGGLVKDGDRSIEDIIKRIPGVEVTPTGQIRVNDKPINALYIDGKNILDGRYALATRNITPDMVSMIQVFENHQPVRALKDFTPSENAAINLKLNNRSKGKTLWMGNLATGAPVPLWDSRLMAFNFSGKFQNMTVVKSNSKGNSIYSDIKSNPLGAAAQTQLLSEDEKNLVNVTGVTPAPIGEERALFNKSSYITSNTLFNTSENAEGSFKIGYSYEHREREERELERFYTESGESVTLGGRSNFKGFISRPEADLSYKINREDWFLQTRLNIRGRREINNAGVNGDKFYNTNARLSQYDGSAVISFIRPFRRSLLKVSTNNHFRALPQKLMVQENEMVVQEVELKEFRSESEISFIKRFGTITAEGSSGVKLNSQVMENMLSGFEKFKSDNYLPLLYLSPSIRYHKERIKSELKLTLKSTGEDVVLSPEISMRYKLSSFWELSAQYIDSGDFSDITDRNESVMMVNYRLYSSGYNQRSYTGNSFYTIRSIYNNPLKLVNITASLSYLNSGSQTINSSYLVDGLIYRRREGMSSNMNTSSLSLSFTKSFFNTPLLLDLRTNYSLWEYETIQMGLRERVNLKRLNIKFKADLSLFTWLDTEAELPLTFTKSQTESGRFSGTNLFTANPSVKISAKLSAKHSLESVNVLYMNELDNGSLYSFPFCDISWRYKSQKREIYAQIINLLDNREYRVKSAGILSSTELLYKLRPITFVFGVSFSF